MERWAPPIEAVNYHIWRSCNMRCKFCFATYDSILPADFVSGLPLPKAKLLVEALRLSGFRKLTFAGGEPTLCPWLTEIAAHAKNIGFKTALVSNGSRMTDELIAALAPNLDWIALSIDSCLPHINVAQGRAVGGRKPMSSDTAVYIAEQFRRRGVRLKINTVVTRLNAEEILAPMIERAKPERWKIMRVLEIAQENDRFMELLAISDEGFKNFVRRNSAIANGTRQIVEDNDDMIASYVMIDPGGRFIDNSRNAYSVSAPILTVGVEAALGGVSLSRKAFDERGGSYDW